MSPFELQPSQSSESRSRRPQNDFYRNKIRSTPIVAARMNREVDRHATFLGRVLRADHLSRGLEREIRNAI